METIRKLIDCKTNQLPHSPHKLSDQAGLCSGVAAIVASDLKLPKLKLKLKHNTTGLAWSRSCMLNMIVYAGYKFLEYVVGGTRASCGWTEILLGSLWSQLGRGREGGREGGSATDLLISNDNTGLE